MSESTERTVRRRRGNSDVQLTARSIVLMVLALGMTIVAVIVAVGYSITAYSSVTPVDSGALIETIKVLGELLKVILAEPEGK